MSVKFRITLVTALLLLIMSIAVTIYTLRAQQREVRRASVRRVEMALSMLAEMAAPPLSIGDVLALADVADRTAQGQPLHVIVADVNGLVLADSRHELYDRRIPAIQEVVRTKKRYIARRNGRWEGADYVRQPYRPRPIGIVYVAISARPMDQANERVARNVASFAFVLICIGVLAAYMIGYYFSRSLKPLMTAIRTSTPTEVETTVPRTGTRELDEIGQAFERMTRQVGAELRNLTALNRLAAELTTAGTLERFSELLQEASRTLVNGNCRLLWGDPRMGVAQLAGTPSVRLATTPTHAAFIAVNERRAVSIGEGSDLPAGTSAAGSIEVASGVVAPLITPYATAVGALIVELDAETRRKPDRQDEATVMAIANLAAPILAALARNWTQQEAMSALTEILVPEEVPQPEGLEVYAVSEPAEVSSGLGGDYYDVLPLGDDRWGIAIGDVSGKGLEAGRYTAMTKYVVRSFALEYDSPAETVSHANAALLAQLEEVRFVTLFYCVVDVKAKTLTYCCAGHLPGLVYSPVSDETIELGVGGGVVGAADLSYTEETVALREGDIVTLYTDGVVEARRDHEEYGSERLKAAIRSNARKSLKNIARVIAGDVRLFAENVLRDDLTMVLLRLSEVSDIAATGETSDNTS